MSERKVESILPLTPMQEGILFHALINPDSGMYFEQFSCKIHGNLETPLFQRAWDQVVHRHAVLRTLVTWKNRKQPLQVVRSEVEIPWTIADWRKVPAAEHDAALAAYLKSDRQKGFDLSQPPLIRLALFQLENNSHYFVWSFHHIMLDGWSMRLVLKEVFEAYEALLKGTPQKLGSVQPFQEYIRWLQRQDLEKAETFWKANLKGFSAPTSLGLSVQQTGLLDSQKQFSEKEVVLNAGLTDALHQFAREHRITLNTLVQGAWALLLSRYSQEADVAFGVTVSGRPVNISGVERMVGLFINTLPLRVQVEFEQPINQWLKSVQSKMLENQAFEFSPLAAIQKWSEVRAGTPLFNSILVFENHPANLDQPDPGGSLETSDSRYIEYSNYPLALLVVPGEQMQIIAIYDNAWFDEQTIERLLSHVTTVFEQMLLKHDAPLSEISILDENESSLLLYQWIPASSPYPNDVCIHQLIERHAREAPSSPAVVYEGQTLSYGQLDQAANILAQQLIEMGVQPETYVGIYLERSPELIIAILGILKAGGAYVPIDPSYPEERVVFLLQDTQCPVVITRKSLAARLPLVVREGYEGDLLMIDELDLAVLEEVSPALPDVNAGGLAYVIYTSGSTGTPKGVMVSHQNLVHSTSARINYYPEKTESFLLLSSFAFDSSLAGIFGTLCQGGKLVLPRQRQEQDAASLVRLIEQHQVTHLLTLPSLYMVLLDLFLPAQLKSLKTVIVAGEACPPDLAARHFESLPGCRLYNEYGPTETTVWCTVYELTRDDIHAPVPIGKPIENTKVYILDQHGHPCPIGIAGELFVGGEGVARGYLNQPALTAQRFLPDPFANGRKEKGTPAHPGARMYRTGDLARWRPDGEIEFLGRVDHQIKIRGYRVELGEIENALLDFPRVREAAVIARQEKTAGQPGISDEESKNQHLEKMVRESPLLINQLLDEIDRLSESEIDMLLDND